MTNLKSLSIVASSKPRNNPTWYRRDRLRARLEEQKRLVDDPSYVRVIQRWTEVDGERVLATKKVRVSPWWWSDANGRISMAVKVRSQPIELEKGKAAIAVSSRAALPEVIDTLIKAVNAGELDDAVKPPSKKPAIVKARTSA